MGLFLDHLTVHDHQTHPAEPVEGVGAGDHHVGVLAGGEGTHPVINARQLSGIDGDTGQGALRVHAAPDGHGSTQGQILDGGLGVVGTHRGFHSEHPQDGGCLNSDVGQLGLGSVSQTGSGDHTGPLLNQQFGDEMSLGAVDNDILQPKFLADPDAGGNVVSPVSVDLKTVFHLD